MPVRWNQAWKIFSCTILVKRCREKGEKRMKTLILSGKYGKTKLTTAKILAALFFGVLAFTLHVLLAFGLPLAAFGTDGWNLPLQINGTTVPYPLTFLEGTLINLGVIYLVLLAMIGVTLFLSARMKSPYLVLTVVVPVLFVPMFLSPNGTSGIYNLLPEASGGIRG